MTANIWPTKSISYWCPKCKKTFFKTDKNGVAICPGCNGKRNDGLNQVSKDNFQCVICKCVFFGSVFKTGPTCPNGCKNKKGKRKDKK